MRVGTHYSAKVLIDEFEPDKTTFYYCVPRWWDKSDKTIVLLLLAVSFVIIGLYKEHYYYGLVALGAIVWIGTFLWWKYSAWGETHFVCFSDVAEVISRYLQATTPYVYTDNGEYRFEEFLWAVERGPYRRFSFNVNGDFILTYYPDENINTRSEGHLMTVENVKGEVAITVFHEQLRP
ncbi:MAG: hypothetical protein IKZ87_00455, partial [Actinomycetaceae bacterium]|nr:hypothetical protein [Actinomycetaceae bacterium]